MNIEIIDGKKYVSVTYRGTEYTLYELCGEWFVSSRRLSLGRSNAGGGKYYSTLQQVAEKCKAFGNVENLINAFYGVCI